MDKNTDRNFELAARQTGMSFQRTRMSADRTLMSIIRTSLALISFGFTIFQFFNKLGASTIIPVKENAAHNFGLALVYLGVFMLTLGIIFHIQYMHALRNLRAKMKQAKLIYAESWFPPSLTLISAILLLIIGFSAILSMTYKIGPF
jgi:putative membrane protein